MDWIDLRTVHGWLHAAVHAVLQFLHAAVTILHSFLIDWGIFILLGLLCWLTWKFIVMMPNVKPKNADARSDSRVRWADVAAPWLPTIGGDPRGTRLEASVVARVALRYDDEKADLVAFLRALSGEGWQNVKRPDSFPQ